MCHAPVEAVLTLPYPPSVNRLHRVHEGKPVKSFAYRQWLKAATSECWGVRRIAGRYSLTVIADRPDRRARDLDNLLKATCDLLQSAGIIENDHLADSILIKWSAAEPAPEPRIVVSVRAA